MIVFLPDSGRKATNTIRMPKEGIQVVYEHSQIIDIQ